MQLELKIQRPKTKRESLEDRMRRAQMRNWRRERSRQLVCQSTGALPRWIHPQMPTGRWLSRSPWNLPEGAMLLRQKN